MDNYQKLLNKIEAVTKKHELDLSSGEDLSVAIMNLIGIEEHLFFTAQKTGKKEYLDLLNEVRLMRVELLKKIIKNYEGEEWCLSKHFLAASMRLMEVGTKELKKGKKEAAWDLFEKAYKLYNLFWGLNLAKPDFAKASSGEKINFLDEKGQKKASASVFAKLSAIIQKAIDCCKE
jgi:hypothetical protein